MRVDIDNHETKNPPKFPYLGETAAYIGIVIGYSNVGVLRMLILRKKESRKSWRVGKIIDLPRGTKCTPFIGTITLKNEL